MAAISFCLDDMVGGVSQATNVGVVRQVSDQWVHISKIDPQNNNNSSSNSNTKLLLTWDILQRKKSTVLQMRGSQKSNITEFSQSNIHWYYF